MTHSQRQTLVSAGLIILIGIGLYGLLPQLGGFGQSLQALKDVSVGYTLGALLVILISYALAAATYQTLALKRLRYHNTVLVELSGLLINRVLPAGIGGLGLNYRYLRQQKHSQAAAGIVITFNNLLGFIGHVMLMAMFLLISPHALHTIRINKATFTVIISLIFVTAIFALIFRKKLQVRWYRFYTQLRQAIATYQQKPHKIVLALLASILMTLSTVACLWLCCLAVSIHVSLVVAFLVFTFGVAIGTATPTPGGVGAVEAGLVAGFVAFKLPSATALAAVLVFRVVSFWLGLLVGAAALVVVQRKRLI